MLSVSDASKLMGKLALFVGTYSRGWSDAQFASCAQNARAMGVDTLIVKVFDGDIAWYDATRIASIRAHVMGAGCGFLPFGYSYGMRFGAQQVEDEAQLALRVQAAANGLVCLDMEQEWNGQDAAAQRLATLLKGHGTTFVSTWADPHEQAWDGVVRALVDVVDVWMPQQYTPWLASRMSELFADGERVIQPTFDLSQEFNAANDPLALATMAHTHEAVPSISLWEYSFAQRNPNLVRAIAHTMGNTLTSSAPVKLPAPTPKPTSPAKPVSSSARAYTYVVKDGDSLSAIATRLGLNWWHDLYLPNQSVIEAAARAHGQQGSGGGSLIYAGTKLTYKK